MTTDLKPHADRVSQTSLKALADARASSAPLRAAGWSIDLSRHYLDAEAEAGLLQFGRVSDLQSAADSLFAGDIVNPSESRPALHWALRAQSELSGEAETVRQSVLPALSFARDVVSGSVTSSTGLPFNAVLHIGIGGSDFGPRLIADAFEDKASGNIDLRFCANVDPFDLDRAMHGLDPTRTLVIGVSKSFGTEETLYNLARARTWLEESVGDQSQQHLALVTANPDRAKAWLNGREAHVFDMPLSVGGRFSLWSAASLACMIYLGADTFEGILKGAAEMDAHVRSAPLEENAAMRLALSGCRFAKSTDSARSVFRLNNPPPFGLATYFHCPSRIAWPRQKNCRWPSEPPPSNTGRRLTPSSVRPLGGLAPAKSSIVAMRSSEMTISSLTWPGLILPGHQAMPGTRWPPS